MDHNYRTVYNQSPALWSVASGVTRGRSRIKNARGRGKRQANSLLVSCAFGLVLLPAGQALAADCSWFGQSYDWFDGTNWESCAGGIPTAVDNVSIDYQGNLDPAVGDNFHPVVGAGRSAESGNIFLRYGGELTVNGLLESGAGLIADLYDPTGVTTVRVEGEDALWTLGNILSVGREGPGALDITDGAEVSNSGNGYVGEFDGSTGTVTVDGAGSRWNNGDRLLVGVLGTGTLNISNGAEVSNGTEAILGDQVSGSGRVTVDDASWISGGLFYVGNYGTGGLDIINGGSVTNTYGTAGFYAGSHGEINVDGAGSRWSSSEEINIGNYGEGSLSITGGGQVIGQSNSRIGSYADGVGDVIVDGAGSRWSNTGTLYVGRMGTGTLTLSNGGEVEVGAGSGALVLADDAGATGTVNIGAESGAAPAAPGTVSAGSLVFGDGDGTLVFNHTDTDYTFAADISGNGTIRQEAGSTHYTGDGSAFSGVVIINSGDFNVQGEMGGNVRIEEGASMVLQIPVTRTKADLALAGSGNFFKTGGGTLDLTGWDPTTVFSGDLNVFAGFLTIGIFNPDTRVRVGGCVSLVGDPELPSGDFEPPPEDCVEEPEPSVVAPRLEVTACVGGTSKIGALANYKDGCVSPGNSIGTFSVKNTWVLGNGGIYLVELKGGGTTSGVHSDLMDVEGTAVLKDGARIHVTPENGSDDGATNYADGSTYVIIEAGTLIVEGATEISDNYSYLNFTRDYDEERFYLISSLMSEPGPQPEPIQTFALDGMSRNQTATADAAFTLGAGHDVYDRVLNMSEAQAFPAMDALSGEIHASVRTALIEDSRLVRNAANDRIRAAFATAGAAFIPVLSYGPGDRPVPVAADHAGPVFWSQGFGSWGSTDSDGNAASLDRSTGGLLVGADTMVGDWRVGLLAGYSHSSFEADSRASSASSSNYHLGLYGGTEWGRVAFRTGAAYSWHDLETSRSVTIPGLNDSLTSDYDAGTFQAFGELGYDIDLETGTRFEPFVNLAHVSLSTDSFSERGGAAALSGRGGSSDVTFTTLGIRGEHDLQLGTVDARLRGMIGWRHAFGDTTPESTHSFSAGDAFTIAGAPIARDSAVIEAGLDLSLTPEATFGLSYHGQIASDAYDHGFKANLAVKF